MWFYCCVFFHDPLCLFCDSPHVWCGYYIFVLFVLSVFCFSIFLLFHKVDGEGRGQCQHPPPEGHSKTPHARRGVEPKSGPYETAPAPQGTTGTIFATRCVMWSAACKAVLMVELTVLRLEAAPEWKHAKYTDLAAECRKAGWRALPTWRKWGAEVSSAHWPLVRSVTWAPHGQGTGKPSGSCQRRQKEPASGREGRQSIGVQTTPRASTRGGMEGSLLRHPETYWGQRSEACGHETEFSS